MYSPKKSLTPLSPTESEGEVAPIAKLEVDELPSDTNFVMAVEPLETINMVSIPQKVYYVTSAGKKALASILNNGRDNNRFSDDDIKRRGFSLETCLTKGFLAEIV